MARRNKREDLVVRAFRMMIRDGEARLTEITVPTRAGGVFTKTIYKVSPR